MHFPVCNPEQPGLQCPYCAPRTHTGPPEHSALSHTAAEPSLPAALGRSCPRGAPEPGRYLSPRPRPAPGTQNSGQRSPLTTTAATPKNHRPGRTAGARRVPPEVSGDAAPLRLAAGPRPSRRTGRAEARAGGAERRRPRECPAHLRLPPAGPRPRSAALPRLPGLPGLGEHRRPPLSPPRGGRAGLACGGAARLWACSARAGLRRPLGFGSGAWCPWGVLSRSLLLCCPSPRPYLSRSVRAPS